uniref:TPR_REGION domain-containing protein n=1 Tax=Syphacia muris TaxID=451379 RepID=A0A0N5AZM4_9BILA
MDEKVGHTVMDQSGDKTACDSSVKGEESKLQQAYQLKEEANLKYKEKDYAGAIYLYHRCLLFARSVHQLSQWNAEDTPGEDLKEALKDESEKDADSEKKEHRNENGCQQRVADSTSRGKFIKAEAADLMIKCYNNLAACIIYGPNRKEEDYLRAVLMQDKNNKKALFRKGSALAKANRYEQAINVLKKCGGQEARVLMQKCENTVEEERRRRDDEIRRNFARHRENDRNHDTGENSTMNGTIRS